MKTISFRVDDEVKDYLYKRFEKSEYSFFSEYLRRMMGLEGIKYPKLNLSSKDKKVSTMFYLIFSLLISLEQEMRKKVSTSPEHKEDMYKYWSECVTSLRIIFEAYIIEIDKESILNNEEDDLSSDVSILLSTIFENENDNGGVRALSKLKKVLEREFNLSLKRGVA